MSAILERYPADDDRCETAARQILEEHFKYPELLEWEPMDEPGLQ